MKPITCSECHHWHATSAEAKAKAGVLAVKTDVQGHCTGMPPQVAAAATAAGMVIKFVEAMCPGERPACSIFRPKVVS